VVERRLMRAQAVELLGLSVRQVQRLANNYRKYGAADLLSRRRGQPNNRSYPK
jgi:hypothetical protein